MAPVTNPAEIILTISSSDKSLLREEPERFDSATMKPTTEENIAPMVERRLSAIQWHQELEDVAHFHRRRAPKELAAIAASVRITRGDKCFKV